MSFGAVERQIHLAQQDGSTGKVTATNYCGDLGSRGEAVNEFYETDRGSEDPTKQGHQLSVARRGEPSRPTKRRAVITARHLPFSLESF